jgi:hypothetical protein
MTGPQVAVQLPLVMTSVEPRKCCPSPNPVGSHCPFEKNSIRKFVLATLSNVPDNMTLPPLKEADVITG